MTRYFGGLRPAIGNARKTRSRERRREPVREPEVRVGLGQRRRDPPPPRREHHRPGDVAAAAEHDVGPAPREDPRAGARARDRRAASARASASAGPPREARDAEGVELVARLRNEPRLDAIRRPGERHLHAARAQRLRDCERRQRRARPSRRPRSGTAARRSLHASPRDVKEDADASERDDEARAAVGDERQRDPGQRREPEDGGEVDRRLAADERRRARPRAACRTGPCSASAIRSPA